MSNIDHFTSLKIARHEAERLGASEAVNKILDQAVEAAQKVTADAMAAKLAAAHADDAARPAAMQERQRRPWAHLHARF